MDFLYQKIQKNVAAWREAGYPTDHYPDEPGPDFTLLLAYDAAGSEVGRKRLGGDQ